MKNTLTDITLIIDRSGSMQARRLDADGGIKEFIRSQKEQPGECLFTLIQFDDKYEFVHKGVLIQDVENNYSLIPRGSTALLDTVATAISQTGSRLSNMKEENRPALVMFVIVTDGKENSSKEFTKQQVRDMIQHQQDVYKWQFTFLGASDSAFSESASIGLVNCAAGVTGACGSVGATGVTGCGGYKSAASLVSRLRVQSSSGHVVSNFYTEEEVVLMKT